MISVSRSPILFLLSIRLFFILLTSYTCSYCYLLFFYNSYFMQNISVPILCYSRFLFCYRASIRRYILESYYFYDFEELEVVWDWLVVGSDLLVDVNRFRMDFCREELLLRVCRDLILLRWMYFDFNNLLNPVTVLFFSNSSFSYWYCWRYLRSTWT